MSREFSSNEDFKRLRETAERLLKEEGKTKLGIEDNDLMRLSHKLEVAYIELELQNQELRRAKAEAEASREEYFDLYNTSPVAYMTLSENALIERANQAANRVLEGVIKDTRHLLGYPFSSLVYTDDWNIYHSFMKKLAVDRVAGPVELRIRSVNGTVYVHLEGVIKVDAKQRKQFRLTMVDISARKQAEEDLRRARDELEIRVKERTADLDKKKRDLENLNRKLQKEIDERKKFEAELKTKGDKILVAYRQRDYLSKRLVDLLEQERHEIGNTLHDKIGQILAGIALELEGLKKVRTEDASTLSDRLDPIQALLRQAMVQAREIAHNLRSDVLERFGLLASIENLIQEVQKQADFKINLFTKNIPDDLKADGIDLTIYRIIQESLTNTIKYAEAKEVFINLTQRDNRLFLTVEDDGKGFDYDTIFNQKDQSKVSLGITIMRERVSMIGGEFRIESLPGRGTHIQAQIPL